MPRIEGGFAIFPSDEGLLVLVPQGDEPVRYYFNESSPGYAISREMEGYLTLTPDCGGDVFHFSRRKNASKRRVETWRVQ